MSEIPINLIFEDSLSGAVLCKLLNNSKQNYIIGIKHRSAGFGWIKKKIDGFNKTAKGMPYLILTDLDITECPPSLMKAWFSVTKHHNLIFCVAVREVESWLLACRTAFAKFLKIKEELIPTNVEEIQDTKNFLIELVKKSPQRQLREDIVPAPNSTAKIGPDYNGRLIYFVEKLWDPNAAKEFSPSLRRTIEILDNFQPILQQN